jgi:hypothetical protein
MNPMINVKVLDALFFLVKLPCGEKRQGMRNSEDVRIVVDGAMRHVETCERCRYVGTE